MVQVVQWCTWQPLSSFESSFASSSRSHAAASISGGMFFATSSGIASSHRSDLTRPAVEAAATRRWHGGCGPRRSASETVQQQAAATSATKRLPRSMSAR